MRTKTLVLAAAAALGLGIFTSQAAVTSANIVGYVNSTINANYNFVCTPFNCGVSNGLNEIFPQIEDNWTFYIWNGSGYNQYLYVSGAYYDVNNGYATVPTPTVAPGSGFFVYNPNPSTTNTYLGAVAIPVGSSITNKYDSSVSSYFAIGSVLPLGGGVITNIDLSLPDNSQVFQWNTGASSFNQYLYSGGAWYDVLNGYATVSEPSVKVGEGLFLQVPTGVATMTQTLPSN